jgi:serine protease Do
MKRLIVSAVFLVVGFAVGTLFVGSWSHGQPQPPLPKGELLRESYREVVKRVLPAVVSIETRAKNKSGGANPQFFDDPRLPEEFRRRPRDPDRLGFGSGFLIDPAGVVATNFHVVEGAEIAVVQLNDGRKFTSKAIRSDRRTDVALIILDAKDEKFVSLEFGDSDAMEIGDRVLAVGAPFGLAGSVTHGIISAKGRNGLNLNMYEDFLQTDAAINPGNSGGPLVNLEGNVVGVCAAIKSKSGGFQGVGLAVASNLAKNVVPSLRETGTVHRGYLGAQINEITPEVAARLGVKDGGVVIANVYDKTPADQGGLVAGDIVVAVAGKPVRDGTVLQRTVALWPIKKAAEFDVIRDGKPKRLTVVIEEQPAEYGLGAGIPAPRNARPLPMGTPLESLGLDAADLTGELAEDMGYRKDLEGVVITRIQDAGPASTAGLRRGAVITRIDDTRILTTVSAKQALEKADPARGVLVQIITPQGGVNYVMVRSPR